MKKYNFIHRSKVLLSLLLTLCVFCTGLPIAHAQETPLTFIDDSDPRIQYTGSWASEPAGSAYQGTQRYCAKGSASLVFTGSEVQVIVTKQHNTGDIRIWVDGQEEKVVNTLSASGKVYQASVFQKTFDKAGKHEIKLEVTGAPADKPYVMLDAFAVREEAVKEDKTVDDRDKEIHYSADWNTWEENVHYQSTLSYTNTVGASLEYTFEGDSIALYGQKSKNSPILEFYLDGNPMGEADMYSSEALGENQALIGEITDIGPGEHVLRAVVSDRKNPAAGSIIQAAVDFLKITGSPVVEPEEPEDVGTVIYQSDFAQGNTGEWNKGEGTSLEIAEDADLGSVLMITPSEHNEYLQLLSAGKVQDGSLSFKIKSSHTSGLGPIIRSAGGQNASFITHRAGWYLGDDTKSRWNLFSSAGQPQADNWQQVRVVFNENNYSIQYGAVSWKGSYSGLNTGKGYIGLRVTDGDKAVPVYLADIQVTTNDDLMINPDEEKRDNEGKLWYQYPAYDWQSEALPLGNGYMGAMVFGQVKNEIIQINDKTLWMGGPGSVEDYTGGIREGAYQNLDDIREALEKGDTAKVNALAGTLTGKVLNENGWGAYQNIGNINLEFDGLAEGARIDQYRRELDIQNGLAKTSYQYDGVNYAREYLVSYPDNVMAFRLAAAAEGKLNFRLNPDIDTVYPSGQPDTPSNIDPSKPTKEFTRTAKDGKITIQGHIVENAMKFEVQYQIVTDGIVTDNEDGTLSVSGAQNATLYVATGTNYKNESSEWTDLHNPPDYRGEDPHEQVTQRIADAVAKGYEAIRADHVQDVSSIMKRVKLDIGQSKNDTPTDELVRDYKKTHDKNLEVLLFQYGRYMLLSSSRDGSLPANLQGVWNNSNKPAWSGDYHFNVNVQMNYWPAYVTNLSETGGSLVDYVDSLVAPGRLTAAEYHGITDGGWTVNTINNPFGMTAPGWAFTWGWSPASNAWICQNLWDAYQFTQDKEMLETKIYPVMREAALFWTKNLVDDGKGGLVSSPTYSPEHGPITTGNTYEQSLVYQLMQDTIEAAQALGVDEDFCTQLQDIKEKLHPYEVGDWGQIKEWREEDSWADRGKSQGVEFGHRHLSHLLGLYPGNQITRNTPELMEAAKVSAVDRTDGGTGWSKAQKISIWARLLDGNHAQKVYSELLTNNLYGNLFAYHPPFQIDGNLGSTAGVAEMLLQSHAGYIDLLPAIPDSWATGSVDGLMARGNFEISMAWADGEISEWKIASQAGNTCAVYLEDFQNQMVVDETGKPVPAVYKNQVLTFETEKGKTYTAVPYEDTEGDKTALQSLYSKNTGRTAADYTAASWTAFDSALKGAKAVLDTEKATQKEVDDAKAALQTAIDKLVNISTLSIVLNMAKSHVTNGDVDKLIPAAKAEFEKALAKAQGVYDNANATQSEVDASWKLLLYVIQALNFVPGDDAKLIELVAAAKAVELNGYEDGATKDAFTTALSEAEALLLDKNAMQADFDAAYEKLEKAMSALIPLPESGDKTQLGVVIETAESYDLSKYVDDANKTNFSKVLAEAKDLYDNNDKATQGEIDAMRSKLLNAMNNLRLRADKETLNDWINALKGIDLNEYTAESASALRAVIAKAEALAAQDLGKDETALIQAMIAEMVSVKENLVKAEDPSKPEEPSDSSLDGSSTSSDNSSTGKPSTDKTPTTGDAAPIAALSLLVVAAAGVILLSKKRKDESN